MSMFGKSNRVKAEEIVIGHLEEKYGESFSAAGTYGEGTSTVEMYVTCESLPGVKIHVYADNWKKSDRTIRDNYLMYKHWDEIQAYIQEQVTKEFKNAIIHAAVVDRTLSPALPADATVEQILQDENAKLYAQVDIPASDFIDIRQAKRVIDAVQADVTDYDFLFISVDEEKYGQLTGQELVGCFDRGEVIRAAVLYRINGNIREIWKEAEG